MKKTPQAVASAARSHFTVGLAAMEKINAVEGIVLSNPVKEAFASFEGKDLSAEQRRAALRLAVVGKTGR